MCSNIYSNVSIPSQRQTIEWVPITPVFYTYNGKNDDYFVYGLDNKVFYS